MQSFWRPCLFVQEGEFHGWLVREEVGSPAGARKPSILPFQWDTRSQRTNFCSIIFFSWQNQPDTIAFVFKPQIKVYKWPLWRWVNYEFIFGLIGINTLSGISFICLFSFLCSITATTMFLYGSRLFISIADMCGYVYTPEVYPTSMRGIGLGACSGAARIGCMITPFVAMVSCAM